MSNLKINSRHLIAAGMILFLGLSLYYIGRPGPSDRKITAPSIVKSESGKVSQPRPRAGYLVKSSVRRTEPTEPVQTSDTLVKSDSSAPESISGASGSGNETAVINPPVSLFEDMSRMVPVQPEMVEFIIPDVGTFRGALINDTPGSMPPVGPMAGPPGAPNGIPRVMAPLQFSGTFVSQDNERPPENIVFTIIPLPAFSSPDGLPGQAPEGIPEAFGGNHGPGQDGFIIGDVHEGPPDLMDILKQMKIEPEQKPENPDEIGEEEIYEKAE
ncbi:MAG: hypothetical protein HZA49_01010 [Planctomycetes bacterium]|nr:hypothetical protein [Planctomycetota bacterium]